MPYLQHFQPWKRIENRGRQRCQLVGPQESSDLSGRNVRREGTSSCSSGTTNIDRIDLGRGEDTRSRGGHLSIRIFDAKVQHTLGATDSRLQPLDYTRGDPFVAVPKMELETDTIARTWFPCQNCWLERLHNVCGTALTGVRAW